MRGLRDQREMTSTTSTPLGIVLLSDYSYKGVRNSEPLGHYLVKTRTCEKKCEKNRKLLITIYRIDFEKFPGQSLDLPNPQILGYAGTNGSG